MSRYLYLVRHGEQLDAEHGLPDGPLSQRGKRQAELIAERLGGVPFTSAHTSPLQRAVETAQAMTSRMPSVVAEPSALLMDCIPSGPSPEMPTVFEPFFGGISEEEIQAGEAQMEDAVAEWLSPTPDDSHELLVTHNFVIAWFVREVFGASSWRPPSSPAITLTGSLRYRWAPQFFQGEVSARQFWREAGSRDLALTTRNNWDPTERSKLFASGNYVSNTGLVRQNSLDPRELTSSINSQAGLQQRFGWGNLSVEARRQQFLTDDRLEMTLPSATLSLYFFGDPQLPETLARVLPWERLAPALATALARHGWRPLQNIVIPLDARYEPATELPRPAHSAAPAQSPA
jgi:probable phosphoglycerate mutase